MPRFVLAFFCIVALLSAVAVQSQQLCLLGPSAQPYFPPVQYNSSYGLCPRGFYCPNATLANPPTLCPPTQQCLDMRFGGAFCEAQGPFDVTLCRVGHYCPNAQTQIPCPEGSYCPLGADKPRKCTGLSYCPAESRKEVFYGAILVLFLVDACIVIAYIGSVKLQHAALQRADEEDSLQRQKTTTSLMDSQGESLVLKSRDASSNADVKTICDAVTSRCKAQGQSSLDIHFNELKLKLPSNHDTAPDKVILDNISGTIRAGRLTAIMGPSGCGKTQLMRVLLGKQESSWERSGNIAVGDPTNGAESLDAFRPVIGFVPQEDILHPDLTVRDNIQYSAMMRFPSTVDVSKRDEVVNAVIKAVGLQRAQDLLVGGTSEGGLGEGGISGGQRKRCNVGVEIAAAPLILFLDEPTTGLDSSTAFDVCSMVRAMAHEANIPVVVVVHQPRVGIWEQIDDLILLGKGGRITYTGERSAVQDYFTSAGLHFSEANPADIIIDAIGTASAFFADRWQRLSVATDHSTAVVHANSTLVRVDQQDPIVDDADSAHQQQDDDLLADIKEWFRLSDKAREEAELGESQSGRSTRLNTRTNSQATTPRSATAENIDENDEDEAAVEIPLSVDLATCKEAFNLWKESRAILATRLQEERSVVNEEFHQQLVDDRPGFFTVAFLMMLRQLQKQQANAQTLIFDNAMGIIGGVMLSFSLLGDTWIGIPHDAYVVLRPKSHIGMVSMAAMFFFITIAAVTGPSGVRAFSNDRYTYWREAAAGVSKLAYYVGYIVADIPRVVVSALHFSVAAYLMWQPTMSFGNFFGVLLFGFFCDDAFASALSHVLPFSVGPLAATVIGVFVALFNGYPQIPFISQTMYTYWASDVMQLLEAEPSEHLYDQSRITDLFGYEQKSIANGLLVMAGWFIGLRILGFLLMVIVNRGKQR